MNVHYVLCVTSCDRHDLLRLTLKSFISTMGLKPRATFIVEDSDKGRPEWLDNSYESHLGKITWLSNCGRMGQVYSIDRLISVIPKDIERVFWLEDDWEFTSGGYIQRALEIIDRYPKICQVVFRSDWSHTLVDMPPFEGFKIAQPYWRGQWGGWTWNPHVTRTAELNRFGTYASQAGYVGGLAHEVALSHKFLEAGCRIAALPGCCRHIGGGRSRSSEDLPPLPKILIAIPVCHRLNYGKWEGMQGDRPDFHRTGQNDRIAALRDTWLKDVAKFPNVEYKLFYGVPHDTVPAEDEVFLNCLDDYGALPAKTIEICKWAKEREYGALFKCDDDTGVYVDRVLHEWVGSRCDYGGYLNGRVCTGGTGYWLSRRAFSIIAEHASASYHWAEDVTVSHFMFHHNIQPVHLAGHRTGREDHWFFKDGYDPNVCMDGISSFHAVRPNDLREWYAKERK